MASPTTTEIFRSDLKVTNSHSPASITDVEHLSSYSWIEGNAPKIAVPGLPPLWKPLKGSQQLEKDSGVMYINQNGARNPDSPMEPLFRSLFTTCPFFHLASIDVVTDRNNIRKLLQFVNPGQDSHNLDTFTINVEVVNTTTIFGRVEAVNEEVIGPHEFRGFGHQFEDSYTTNELSGSKGHHRIIAYRFCGMRFLVRHETDGYLGSDSSSLHGGLSELMDGLSLDLNAYGSDLTKSASKLKIVKTGHAVSLESTLEIKTRTTKNPLTIEEVAPQLWVSQTPKLVRAYHDRGKFLEPNVEDVSTKIKIWEAANQSDLMKLGGLIEKIGSTVKSFGSKATIKYDKARARLVIEKVIDLANMLPEDLYVRWNDDGGAAQGKRVEDTRLGDEASISKTDKANTKDVEESSLFNSGVAAGKHVVPDSVPFAITIRSALDKGFRQFFRDMPMSLQDYQALCESLKTLDIDVLQGRKIRELIGDFRSGKEDWDPEEYRKVSGSKSTARDSAFRLLYTFLQEEAVDGNAAFNATVFVVSHFRIFKYKTRKMVRQAFDFKFTPSLKQRRELDKWPIEQNSEEDDATTEGSAFSDFWDSDNSY